MSNHIDKRGFKDSARFYRDVLGIELSTAGVLRGAPEVCIDGNVPLIKQPFWDVASVPVPLAQLRSSTDKR